MTGIKICGITRVEDALAAAGSGVDALGFIFHAGSPRRITPEEALAIISVVPAHINTVGVFVNEEINSLRETAARCRIDMIQLHGDESSEYARELAAATARPIIKAFDFRNDADVARAAPYPADFILADTRSGGLYGGTGRTGNWKVVRAAARVRPLILAGGLAGSNILEALKTVGPAWVDLNSGIESAPGIKNHEKMRETVGLIRQHDVGVRSAFLPFFN